MQILLSLPGIGPVTARDFAAFVGTRHLVGARGRAGRAAARRYASAARQQHVNDKAQAAIPSCARVRIPQGRDGPGASGLLTVKFFLQNHGLTNLQDHENNDTSYPRSSIEKCLCIGVDVGGLLLSWDPKALLQHLRDLLSQCLVDLHLGEEIPIAALGPK